MTDCSQTIASLILGIGQSDAVTENAFHIPFERIVAKHSFPSLVALPPLRSGARLEKASRRSNDTSLPVVRQSNAPCHQVAGQGFRALVEWRSQACAGLLRSERMAMSHVGGHVPVWLVRQKRVSRRYSQAVAVWVDPPGGP